MLRIIIWTRSFNQLKVPACRQNRLKSLKRRLEVACIEIEFSFCKEVKISLPAFPHNSPTWNAYAEDRDETARKEHAAFRNAFHKGGSLWKLLNLSYFWLFYKGVAFRNCWIWAIFGCFIRRIAFGNCWISAIFGCFLKRVAFGNCWIWTILARNLLNSNT